MTEQLPTRLGAVIREQIAVLRQVRDPDEAMSSGAPRMRDYPIIRQARRP